MANEDQIEELEALRSIYMTELTEISIDPPCFMIKLQLTDIELPASISIKFTLPPDYPAVRPVIEIPMRSKVLSPDTLSELIKHLNQTAEDSLNMAMVFTLVDTAQQWMSDNSNSIIPQQTDNSATEVDEVKETVVQNIKLQEPTVTGGRWEYVIGLVGKPSAGKSTFFNAATSLDLAKTGAHPFTTIEPNIGKAFYSIPCPCEKLPQRCDSAHGHDYNGNRYLPVLLKDVAGLVPGAWEGKGRGNRFLNDLLDADVLIHIIDVSGTTNEKGEETTDYDPASDVHWLKQELHQWIFQNVWSRWDSIVKRPKKLIDMFTGYHANRAVIHTAIHNAGVTELDLGKIYSWNEEVLHKIVDEFLSLRFPILLALNKADKDGADIHIQRLTEQFDESLTIPVSAKSECYLQHCNKDNIIKYEFGSKNIEVSCQTSIDDQTRTQLESIQNNVLNRFGSTNVHAALCKAVKLREPCYAFPVSCLETFRSVKTSTIGVKDSVLRDCMSLKPGSTVNDLYTVMCHYPVGLLTGDFVRAETVNEDRKKRPVRKDEIISSENNIIKIMTTKKS